MKYDHLADIGTPEEIAAALEDAMPIDVRGSRILRDAWASGMPVHKVREAVDAWRTRHRSARNDDGPRRPGPGLIVSRAEVDDAAVRLRAAGARTSHSAIARELGVSVSTVKRRRAGAGSGD